ncbi:MAG: usg protein [Alphaproteobacteria bacterium]|nr:usg protein [Alphaproteobacteria bacterium]
MATFERQLNDYRLTTAHIYYHMPDHVHLLQEFLWQEYDLAPRFPMLHKFLDFWVRELEGKLHSVYVAKIPIITPGDCRFAAWQGTLH